MTKPLIPTVTASEYAAERVALFHVHHKDGNPHNNAIDNLETRLIVHNSLRRRVALNGQQFHLSACDWPSAKLAEEAASAASLIFARNEAYRYFPLDNMADIIARDIGQDLSRPYGFALILEPV